jgi:hypothetical protein
MGSMTLKGASCEVWVGSDEWTTGAELNSAPTRSAPALGSVTGVLGRRLAAAGPGQSSESSPSDQ